MAREQTRELTAAAARVAIYRFLAQVFHIPSGSEIPIRVPEYWEEYQRSLTSLPAGHEAREEAGLILVPTLGASKFSSEEVAAEYVRLFSSGQLCPHYEADFVGNDIFRQSNVIADVNGFYGLVGLVSRPGAERPDFIGTELELMVILVSGTMQALQQGAEARARWWQDMERRFLEMHLGRWAPQFGKILRAATTLPLLEDAGSCLERFVEAEITYLGARPEKLGAGLDGRERCAPSVTCPMTCGQTNTDELVGGAL